MRVIECTVIQQGMSVSVNWAGCVARNCKRDKVTDSLTFAPLLSFLNMLFCQSPNSQTNRKKVLHHLVTGGDCLNVYYV